MSITQDVCTTHATYIVIPPGCMQLLLALTTKLGDLPLFRSHKYAPLPLLLSLQLQLCTTQICALCSGRCSTATYVAITEVFKLVVKFELHANWNRPWTICTFVIHSWRGSLTLAHGAQTYREWFMSLYWACESGDSHCIKCRATRSICYLLLRRGLLFVPLQQSLGVAVYHSIQVRCLDMCC